MGERGREGNAQSRAALESYCGNNWQDAYDKCNEPCTSGKDEDCGLGFYCFGYVECTPRMLASRVGCHTCVLATSKVDVMIVYFAQLQRKVSFRSRCHNDRMIGTAEMLVR